MLLGLSVTGCWRTTISHGETAAREPSPEWESKWHSGFINGVAEATGPYELKQACPDGWANIYTRTNFWAGLVTNITYSIYTAQNVSVACSANRAAPSAAKPASPQPAAARKPVRTASAK